MKKAVANSFPVHFFLLFLVVWNIQVSAFRLTVLHTNDLHSRFDQVSKKGGDCDSKPPCYGGVARIKHLADTIRAQNPNTVFLNAGDFFQGTVYYSMFKWKVVANLTSSLGYDASCLGNHEFDDGVADLEAYSHAIKDSYPLLACNLDISSVQNLNGTIKPYIIQEIGDSVNGKTRKVAIIGYVTPETKEISDSGEVVFIDEVVSLRKAVKEVQDKGANIIIALGHSGYERDLEIAEQVEGLDIVVGGHTNTFLWNGPVPDSVGYDPVGRYPTVVKDRVLVVQTNGYGRYLGRLDVDFDPNGNPVKWHGNPLLLNQTYAQDQALQKKVEAFKHKVASKMDTVVGSTVAYIDGGRPKCRLEECSFGNFATDAMASEMKVDIAILNSGGIKDGFDPKKRNGDITIRDIYTAMPWGNTIDTVTMSGRTLKEVLEHAVARYDAKATDPGGRFLQVHGLVLTYDVRRPAGQRLVNAESVAKNQNKKMRERISDTKLYEVAMPSFLALGGDRFTMIPESTIEYKNTGFLDNDLLEAYLRKNNPLQLPEAGRIVVISEEIASSAITLKQGGNFSLVSIIFGFIVLATKISSISA